MEFLPPKTKPDNMTVLTAEISQAPLLPTPPSKASSMPKILTDGASMDHLDALEAQSIYILREAFSRLKKLALLWSLGKDSNVMIWLARKAFFGRVPSDVRLPPALAEYGIDGRIADSRRDEEARRAQRQRLRVAGRRRS